MVTRQLTIAVEGTAALGSFWQTILSDYLDKIIRCFCSAEPAGQKSSNVELSLVMFNSHGSYSACLVQRSGWTRDMDIFFQWLSAIQFAGGGFNDAAIAEGLAEVLMMFSTPTGSQNQNAEVQRHCILVAASNPYPLPTPVYRLLPKNLEKSENIDSQPDNRLSDAETLAKSFGQCGISLSVLCPKQLSKLRGIYNAAKRNLRVADPPVDNVKNPHFLVLISENFIEAHSSLSRSGITSLPLNQNIVKTDVTAVPPISGPPPASVPSANGSILVRQQISVGNIPPATVKVEPTTVTSMAGGPAFPPIPIPSVSRAASQAVPSLQTSSPMSTSQEMIPNNENVPDTKPLVNNLTPQVRPVGGAAANVRILNDVAQARQALAGGTSIGFSSIGGAPMLSNMISSGITSSIPPSQSVISSAPLGVASISGSLPVSGAGPVPNSSPAQFISATSNPPINSNLGMTQPLGNIQGSVSLGQTITSMSQGNLPGTQMVQTGMSMNQNMMSGSGTSGIASDNGAMMPTPGMSHQGQPGIQQLIGVNNSNSMTNMALNQQTSNTMPSTKSKYIKVWEGNLSGQRQGQPVFITRLEGYRNSSASETLAANWPPTMQIVRLISQDHMNNKQYVGKADFLVFRAMNQHGFLGQLQEKKLCAVIQLPSQTLLLSVTDIAHRLIGMLFPGDMVVFKPQISNQQQLQAQLQQQQNMQQQQQQHQQIQQQQQQPQQQLPQMQHQQPLSHMQQQQQQPLMQIQQQQMPQVQQQQIPQLQQQQQIPQMQQQQQIPQMQQQQQIQQQQIPQMQQQQQIPQMQQQQQIPQMQQQQIPQMQQQQSQQIVGTGMNQSYIQGGGRSQLLSQGQVSSQGPPNISGGSGFMS